MRRIIHMLRREDGNATIEFALLFPALMTLFLMVVETGVLMTRGVMLDRATDIAMRQLRLGTLDPMTPAGLRTEICNNAVIIPDCPNVLTVELRPVPSTTWAPYTGPATCINRDENIDPLLEFTPGIANELMMVRVCAKFDPFFPSGKLAAQIKTQDGGYALVAMSAFVNEP